jgi:hypothetical protein
MQKITYVNPSGTSIELSEPMYGLLSVEGLGVPNLTIQEKKAPFQHGSTYIDQLSEPREIVANGMIGTPRNIDIYAHRRIMANAFNPLLGPGTFIYENDNGSWFLEYVTPQGPIYANRDPRQGSQKWQITFYAYNPFWMDVNAISTSLAGEGTINITNNGDYACPVELVINGPITNPKVINNTTGEYIKIEKTLAAGDYALIYTGFGEHTIYIGTGELPALSFPISGLAIPEKGLALSTIESNNGIQYLDLASTFFQLAVGVNQLELIDEGTNTGMSLDITYRQQYIGV